ncbi:MULTISPECIES: hypothetical protein [Calothrix]|uniref:Uncharacterized protein n=2 Tax=Calothrix TaxID=1186 RepID=A0ABR8AFJ1_9CYAN|nr:MULTISPECIES: hypothetical protein [Calothrix]MBD2198688.1 hypothetical protein [Calothrix parietina FACHB-288]MBD2228697.1 hypothetical protein [Calothrix anomala FACHB-343]
MTNSCHPLKPILLIFIWFGFFLPTYLEQIEKSVIWDKGDRLCYFSLNAIA